MTGILAYQRSQWFNYSCPEQVALHSCSLVILIHIGREWNASRLKLTAQSHNVSEAYRKSNLRFSASSFCNSSLVSWAILRGRTS